MKRLLCYTCSLSLLFFAACKDITHVQTGYVSDRDECRSHSENNVGVYSQPESYPLSDKERNSALLQLFCECMKDKEWKVAGCPKPATTTASTPAPATAPTVVIVQSPAAQPAVLPAPPPAPPPPATPVKHVAKKKKAVCAPPQTCPAPADYDTPNQSQAPAQSDQQLQGILQRQ